MRTRGNDIFIQRGETFSIDRSIKNADGSPYRVDESLVEDGKEAYFLLTISSDKYETNGRYLRNWWLPITNFVSNSTQVITDYNDRVLPPIKTNDLYYFERDGEYIYAKYDGTKFVEYSMRFVKHFASQDTLELTGRNYFYSITLVIGQTTRSYLEGLYAELDETPGEYLTLTQMKEYLIAKFHNVGNYVREELVKNLDTERPLMDFDVSRPIISPSNLIVMSNMRGSQRI